MKEYILLAAAAMAMVACSNDNDKLDNGLVEAIITAGVDSPQSRALNDSWEQDEIGVMVTDAPNSTMEDIYKNVKYTTAASGVGAALFTSSAKGIFFQDANETVTFAAYAPYQPSGENALPGTDGVISSSTENQSTRDLQKAFDYIYASGATASRSNWIVEFKDNNQFYHKMSRLVITVKTSTEEGFTADEVARGTYTLGGLTHSGRFNVVTGTAEATGTATEGDWSLSDNSLKTESTGVVTFTSILYPQTLGSALTFTATIGGQHYANNSGINPAFEAGKSYSYTVTVRKTGLSVSGCTIGDWTDEGNVDVDANI